MVCVINVGLSRWVPPAEREAAFPNLKKSVAKRRATQWRNVTNLTIDTEFDSSPEFRKKVKEALKRQHPGMGYETWDIEGYAAVSPR